MAEPKADPFDLGTFNRSKWPEKRWEQHRQAWAEFDTKHNQKPKRKPPRLPHWIQDQQERQL